MLFEWEERGKATLLGCVRKLKHERESLDWIFHSGRGTEQLCCPRRSQATIKQGRSTEVSKQLFWQQNGSPETFGFRSLSRWGFLCEFPNAMVSFPSYMTTECSTCLQQHSGQLLRICGKEVLPVTAVLCAVSQPGTTSLLCPQGTPGRSTTHALDLLHHPLPLHPSYSSRSCSLLVSEGNSPA